MSFEYIKPTTGHSNNRMRFVNKVVFRSSKANKTSTQKNRLTIVLSDDVAERINLPLGSRALVEWGMGTDEGLVRIRRTDTPAGAKISKTRGGRSRPITTATIPDWVTFDGEGSHNAEFSTEGSYLYVTVPHAFRKRMFQSVAV